MQKDTILQIKNTIYLIFLFNVITTLNETITMNNFSQTTTKKQFQNSSQKPKKNLQSCYKI